MFGGSVGRQIQLLYAATVVIHITTRTTQLSKENEQSIITLRHKGQSIQKTSRTLNVSVTKTIKHFDETGTAPGKQDQELPQLL